jgi:hypothetical protein
MSAPFHSDPNLTPADRPQERRWTVRDMLSWSISLPASEASLGKYALVVPSQTRRSLFQPIDEK